MPDAPDLFSDFEVRGSFWLADAPDRCVPGVVRVRHGEVVLALEQSFPRSSPAGALEASRDLRIYGRSIEGVDLTLEDAFETLSTDAGSEYTCSRLHTGIHLTDTTPVASVAFHLTNLEDWLAWSPFRGSPSDDGSFSWTLGPLPTETYTLDGGLELRVRGLRDITSSATQRTLGYSAIVEIAGNDEQSFQYHVERQQAFRTFLAILIGRAVYNSRLVFTTTAGASFNTYYEQNIKQLPPTLSLHRIAFPFQTVRERLGEYFNGWIAIVGQAESSIDLFLGTLYNETSFIESQFLALTQALESLHRRLYPGTYVPDAQYEVVKQALGTAISSHQMPNDLRDALRARIRYGNEFSMRRRMRDLLAEFDAQVLSLVTARDADALIRVIVDARNHLTHDPVGEPERPAGQRLYNLLRQVALLTRLYVLARIGIPADVLLRGMRLHATARLD